MEKLPHERLREVAKSVGYKSCEHLASIVGASCNKFNTCIDCINAVTTAIADDIEKYYDPKLRDTEGNPVHKGLEVDGGVIDGWAMDDEGNWEIYDKDINPLQRGKKDTPVKLSERKVFDADGVEINVGDTVWGKYNGVEHEVIGFDTCDGLLCVSIRNVETGSTGGASPNLLTHREPDSLEKLYSDMGHDETVKDEYIDRLAALLERDV